MFLRCAEKIKEYIFYYPTAYFFLYRFFHKSDYPDRAVSERTEIIIEGFPRSANTFAVLAFTLAQRRNVLVTSHFHAEAQVLHGVKLGIPVIVLIRHPVDAIASLMLRHPASVKRYARRYINFYSRILCVRENIIFADFHQVTQEFGSVIGKVNDKFSTEFKAFVHSKKNVDFVFQQIDEINRQSEGGKVTHLARPAEFRSNEKFSIDESHPLILEAIRLYEAIICECYP